MIDQIKNLLKQVEIIEEGKQVGNIIDLGMVSAIIVKDNRIGFAIDIADYDLEYMEQKRQEAINILSELTDKKNITIALTQNNNFLPKNNRSKEEIDNKHDVIKENKSFSEHNHGHSHQNNKQLRHKELSGINKIILVASGKGGVGKSTFAANLATSLASMNKKVGLVDADIYGPSIHKMFAIDTKPEVSDNNQMMPVEKYGVKVMSMGMLIGTDSALVWRGPMITKAITQLMIGVNWGELDYLIIDTPPGTGDILLTISKNFYPDGVIIISTPQEIALIDAIKSVDMFKKLGVNILGMVENMSYFLDKKTLNKTYIFGEKGVENFAINNNINFLGDIPIDADIVACADSGTPISISKADSESTMIYAEIVKKICNVES